MIPLDVADVEARAAVHAGPATHQLFQQDIVAESDVENAVDGEELEVGFELSLGSGEAVEDDSLR